MSGSGFSFGTGATGSFNFTAPTTTSSATPNFSFLTPTTSAVTTNSSEIKMPGFSAPTTAPSGFTFNLNPTTTTATIASVPPSTGTSLFNINTTSAPSNPAFNVALNLTKSTTSTVSVGSTTSSTPSSFSFTPSASTNPVVTSAASSASFGAVAPSSSSFGPVVSSSSSFSPVVSSSSFGPVVSSSSFGPVVSSSSFSPVVSSSSSFGQVAPSSSSFGSVTSSSNFGPVATLSTATSTSSFGTLGGGGATNLSMRQLEERLNKWLVELKEQEERFLRQATHVNAWDQILQNGHEQVQQLKDTLHTVKSDQLRLEAEIDFIRGQQEELERLLEPLESATNANPAVQLHQGDRQRDNMYYLAQSLDAQLRQMTDDLGKVIEHLNTNSGSLQPNDPVSLVARVLSAHMDALKWVDQNTTLLSQKVDDVARVSANVGKRG